MDTNKKTAVNERDILPFRSLTIWQTNGATVLMEERHETEKSSGKRSNSDGVATHGHGGW